jgi:chloramphenicol 3-O phosphotransferase
MPGNIILLNGASSSGKSTLAGALQSVLPLPFWHYSIDHLLEARVLPSARIKSGEFPWTGLRQQFFEGFHNSIPALAQAGNHLVVEHIVESRECMNRLLFLLADFDVFFVGLHCPLEELERRERERGNRRIGEAKADAEVTHTFGLYDHECSSTDSTTEMAARVAAAWAVRTSPSAFTRMASAQRGAA